MPTLQIDGVGSVEVGPEFTRLTPDQQNATVDEIIASIKGGAAPAAAAPQPAPMAPRPAGEVLEPPPPPAPPPEPGLTAAAGRVAGRAGEAAAERFGDRPLGLSDQTIQELRASGALASEGRAPTPIQLLNEVVYRFGTKAGDAVLRSIGAGLGALGGAAEQTAVELGEDPGMAKRLGRDVPLLAEVAATVAGAPGAQTQAAAARGTAQTQRAAATAKAAAPTTTAAPEAISSAAVRVNGEIFTGPIHWNAMEAAAKKLGVSADEILNRSLANGLDDVSGFVTTRGRYVTREEAIDIAERGGQVVNPEVPRAQGRLVAQDLKKDYQTAAQQPAPIVPPTAGLKTTEDFKTAARSFYKQADDAGVVVKPTSVKSLSDDVFSTAAREGLDPTLTPNSMAAVKRIQELADPATGPVSFQSLDLARKIASDAKGAARGSDRRIASIVVEKLDDYIAGLASKDVVTGDAKLAAQSIVQARDLWSRAAKLDTVDDLVTRAADSAKSFSGSGFENALRTEFKNLAKNAKRMRTFTAEEQNAIRRVARGTASANAARAVGKLAPTGVVSGALGGGIGAAAGTALGIGPVAGAVAAGSVGFIGRKLATVLAQRSIRRLEQVIREGGESAAASSAIGRGNALIAQLTGAAAPAAAGQSKGD